VRHCIDAYCDFVLMNECGLSVLDCFLALFSVVCQWFTNIFMRPRKGAQ
jgi:hypothetical protein